VFQSISEAICLRRTHERVLEIEEKWWRRAAYLFILRPLLIGGHIVQAFVESQIAEHEALGYTRVGAPHS
jgi:hypothetical protein